MNEPICGQVVRILSDRELVIDAGSSQGVREGMLFDIRGYIDIEDPDSQEILESLLVSKVKVKTSLVGERVSVARTYRQIQSNFARAWLSSDFVGQIERIKSDSISGHDVWEKEISIGDEAIQIIQETQA